MQFRCISFLIAAHQVFGFHWTFALRCILNIGDKTCAKKMSAEINFEKAIFVWVFTFISSTSTIISSEWQVKFRPAVSMRATDNTRRCKTRSKSPEYTQKKQWTKRNRCWAINDVMKWPSTEQQTLNNRSSRRRNVREHWHVSFVIRWSFMNYRIVISLHN